MRISSLFTTVLLGCGLVALLMGGLANVAPATVFAMPTVAALSMPSLQAELVLTPTKDNTIYESVTGALSNGQGIYLFAGKNGVGNAVRSLLHFDLAGSLPTTATVLNVTLRLDAEPPGRNQGPMTVGLHRLLANWGEGASNAPQGEAQGADAAPGDATWLHTFFSTTQWSNPGADFVTTASATTIVDGDGVYTWSSPALLTDVQDWLADPGANFGWILVGEEDQPADIKRFASRDYTTAASRPQLVITYQTKPSEERILYLPLVQYLGE
jgi:hypothetical protein